MTVELFGLQFSLFADEDFRWTPYVWRMNGRHTGEAAKYYGHSYAISAYWLCFEFQVVWVA